EHIAMGKIDHADDTEHHGVADGDQAVDGAERNAVDELLDEIIHAVTALRIPPKVLTGASRSGNCGALSSRPAIAGPCRAVPPRGRGHTQDIRSSGMASRPNSS